jgi:two-component system, NtrC family, sensor histidine kinase AtoS
VTLRGLLERAGRRFDSLQTRLLAGTVLILLVVMAGVIMVVEYRQRAAIIGEVLRRGEVIARDLAAISSSPLLLYNFTALEQNVDRVRDNSDVAYAIVLDAEGTVAAYSRRPELVGRVLSSPLDARAVEADAFLVQEVVRATRAEGVYDFAVPVLIGAERWGTVRVGLSKRRMEAQIRRTRIELAGLTAITLLVGGIAAALGARAIARPVRELAAGAEAIARGELDQRIVPTGFGEIGQLAIVFNHMTAQLLQQRRDLEATHESLRERFQEVADLKSYTDSVLSSITSGIVTLDLDGRVATVNPAAELLTGLFSGEIAGRYCTEVFAHTPEVAEILMETLARRAGTATVSLSLRRRNDTSVPVEMSTAPLRGLEGKDLGVVGVFRDVSQVRELEGQLRRSDRLAALGTLAAGLAHEIKNPLASLRTFTRIIPRKFEDVRFRETFMRVVPHELERINGIVEQLLELARPSRLRPVPLAIPGVLDRVLELYANELDAKGITVSREYAREVPAITADPERLYEAFVNLVSNALAAMAPGGRLTVRNGWHRPADPVVRAAGGRRVRIEIEDTGSGISPLEAEKVFDPFFTTKAEGTGLGLALTHKIIDDHGGSISFRSTPGVGTVFTVLLPIAADRPAGARDV